MAISGVGGRKEGKEGGPRGGLTARRYDRNILVWRHPGVRCQTQPVRAYYGCGLGHNFWFLHNPA